jgi:ornithine carbamoyltransferase
VAFSGYTVDERLMAAAHPEAVFMHCLPAHRGEEVADVVIDGPQSVVVEQAENRLHLQKALLVALAGGSWNRVPRKLRGRKPVESLAVEPA